MLEHLLRNLALQNTDGLFDFSVVVVDNDMKGPARETVMRLKSELGLDISYGIEPEQSIPAARNHALRLARGNFIAIIDDDEFPPQHWLSTMYHAIKTFDVDGSLGPVVPFFETPPPTWLLKSGFCERPVHRTGTLLQWHQTRTGNVLLKKAVFEKHNICFDVNFTTGEDRAFFKEAIQAGCRFVAVAEAPVYEIVPPERWLRSYYLKRALVYGVNSQKYTASEMHGISLVLIPLKSIIAVLTYFLVIPFCACLGNHVMMNYLERGAHHLSRLLAMLGFELIKKKDL